MIAISAYMSSIRPYRWMSLHAELVKVGLPFEMVIVGPNRPDFELPPEIRYYHSDVKPSQCFHAAASLCVGETLLQIVDDITYDDGVIQAMYDVVTQQERTMATAHYWQNETNFTQYQNIAGQIRSDIPLLPVCGMYPRAGFIEMQGLDRRFDGVMSELDLYMRLSVAGYKTVFVNGIVRENIAWQTTEGTSLCGKFWAGDRGRFVNLWSTNDREDGLCSTRKDGVLVYSDEGILTENQYG